MLNRLLILFVASLFLAACASDGMMESDDTMASGEETSMSSGEAAGAPPPDLPEQSMEETEMAAADEPEMAAATSAMADEFTVYFDYESDILTPEAEAVIDQATQAAMAKGAATIAITGHADNRGTASQNERMSRRRAQQVADAFVFRGIDPGNMDVTWVGAQDLAVPTPEETREAGNRRVVISLR